MVFQVLNVVRYLFWLGKLAEVRDEEITVLKKYIKEDIESVVIENIKPGDKITIKKGVFKGKEGLVEEISKNRKQLVLLSLGIKIVLSRL